MMYSIAVKIVHQISFHNEFYDFYYKNNYIFWGKFILNVLSPSLKSISRLFAVIWETPVAYFESRGYGGLKALA